MTETLIARAREAVGAWDHFDQGGQQFVPGVKVLIEIMRELLVELDSAEAGIGTLEGQWEWEQENSMAWADPILAALGLPPTWIEYGVWNAVESAEVVAAISSLGNRQTITTIEELRALPVGSVVLWQWRPGRTLSAEKIDHGNGWSEGSYEQFEDSFTRKRPTCTLLWNPEQENA